jgi:replication factor A1
LRHKKSKGEYLAFLSVKYGLNSENFLAAIRQAADEGKATRCCQFLVECRGKTKKDQIFSIKNASGIIAQFKVSNDFLVEKRKSLEEFMLADIVRGQLATKRKAARPHFIKNLWAGMKHINLEVKVLALKEPRHAETRYGYYADMAKFLIADETGAIKLCLWNEEIDVVSVGDTVRIINARMSVFGGERQLTLGIKGSISRVEGYNSKVAAPVLLPN